MLAPDFWRDKRVFITGHTGFKGGWLSLLLSSLGAKISGYALAPEEALNFFDLCNIEGLLAQHIIADIRHQKKIEAALSECKPDIVLHLAAQPLVRRSYQDPVATYETNVLGTVNILEAARRCPSVRVVLNVTTDKCYQNDNAQHDFKEGEPLGGFDPYSSSKACSELVTQAYRDSFYHHAGVALATVRAGNVIGGGDWSEDRLIPDIFRAAFSGRVMKVRYPQAVRPWQHVLEPLFAYLSLVEKLWLLPNEFEGAWNIGPEKESIQPVSMILNYCQAHGLKDFNWQATQYNELHEAGYLSLDINKAKQALSWRPVWTLTEALDAVIDWYKAWHAGRSMKSISMTQISLYQEKFLEIHK